MVRTWFFRCFCVYLLSFSCFTQVFAGNWWDVFIRPPHNAWMGTYFARVHPALLEHIPIHEGDAFRVEIYYCYEAFGVLYEFEAMAWLGRVILGNLQDNAANAEPWSEAAFVEAVAAHLPNEGDVRARIHQVLTGYIEHLDVDAWQLRIGTVIERCPRGGIMLNEAFQALRAIVGQHTMDSIGQLEQACARARAQFEQAELTGDTVEALCWRMAQNEDSRQGRAHIIALLGNADLSQSMELLFRTVKLMLLRGTDHRDYPRLWNCAVGAMVQSVHLSSASKRSSKDKKRKSHHKHACSIQ